MRPSEPMQNLSDMKIILNYGFPEGNSTPIYFESVIKMLQQNLFDIIRDFSKHFSTTGKR